MGRRGNFIDVRIGLTITQAADLVTSKLPAVLDYQSSLRTPDPPRSCDKEAAKHGAPTTPDHCGRNGERGVCCFRRCYPASD